jgi:hypothetical protein
MNETTQNLPTSNKSNMFSRRASKKLVYILLKLMVPLRHRLLALASGAHRNVHRFGGKGPGPHRMLDG